MDIATALKSEISRVSRKEVKSEIQTLKKGSVQYRSDIAALKRRVTELERLVKQLSKDQAKKVSSSTTDDATTKIRFSAQGLVALRKKLALSSAQMGLLIGVSDQSVYKYEKGEVQPRANARAAIAELRKLGKREVREILSRSK